jgi:vacuolar protein 8
VQLLESEDETLTNNIRASPILLTRVKQLAAQSPGSRSQGSSRRGSTSDDEGSAGENGAGEIAGLAKRILSLTEGGSELEGDENDGEHAELRASVHQALNGQQQH